MILIVLILLLVCVKCNKNTLNDEKENDEIPNVNLTDIKSEENTELYISTNGYELKYNPNNFLVTYENNNEKFVHKVEDVYMNVRIIPAADAEATKKTIQESTGAQGECSFANGTLNGFYTDIELNDENKIKRSFILDLPDKSIIIIETKMYESTEKNKKVNEEINKMIDTIKIK